MEDIANIALNANNPPNFSDQCAAFISSDINTAFQEGVSREDIIAGLVYSICINYVNRVKGSRQVGKKVFMQGGVCYNKAVPIAMASLTGREIIVPPHPGLMGAFGVALELKNLFNIGNLSKKEFSLKELAERKVEYGKSFKCHGHLENCDIGCEVAMIHVNGKKIPFGGACNKYYNLKNNKQFDIKKLNHIEKRVELLFSVKGGGGSVECGECKETTPSLRASETSVAIHYEENAECKMENENANKDIVIGLNRSFQINTLNA